MVTESEYRAGKTAKRERGEIVAKRVSWPMVTVLMTCAKANDLQFRIDGKRGHGRTANYSVTFDGQRLTPAQASAIISAWKA